MGANMARRLKDRQFHVTAVYDTNRVAATSLAAELGCAAAQDLSEVTAESDVIFTVVTDDNAIGLTADQVEYPLPPEVSWIVWAEWDGTKLEPNSTYGWEREGLGWREAGTIGILMNTRGLMELVILNVGRDLGVITPAVFAMMVLMALVTTLATTPILRRLAAAPAGAPRPSELIEA